MAGVKKLMPELLAMGMERFGDRLETFRKAYRIPRESGAESRSKQDKVVNDAAKTAWKVIRGGGTEKEVNDALKYFMICYDSEQYNLDYLWCAIECGYSQLKHKYANVQL